MKLQSPIRIGTHTVNSRLVLPPMATAKSTEDGHVTDELCAYYRERARGAYNGLIITEHSYISMQGKASACQMSLAEDDVIDGLKRLTGSIHAGGSLAICQLNHAGSATTHEITGCEPVSASAVPNIGRKAGLPEIIPHALSVDEIHEIQDVFVRAALRAKAGGYDGVEIHSAHGYLLNQFYSPMTNHRDDDYGCQTIKNRTRFACETLKAVRDAVGKDFLLAIRLGGCDYMEGGSTIEDAVQASLLFETAGADLLDLSGGMCRFIRPGHEEPGYFADMSTAICQALRSTGAAADHSAASAHMPVILTGGVKHLTEAEQLLDASAADLIGIGRAQLTDGDFARREYEELGR